MGNLDKHRPRLSASKPHPNNHQEKLELKQGKCFLVTECIETKMQTYENRNPQIFKQKSTNTRKAGYNCKKTL